MPSSCRNLRRPGDRPRPGPGPAARSPARRPGGGLSSVPVLRQPGQQRLLPQQSSGSRSLLRLTTGSVHLCPFSDCPVLITKRGVRGERCPAGRDRVRLRRRGQGGRPSRPDAAASGLLCLPVQRGRPVPADQAGRVQAHLAGRLDQHLLRASAARRAGRRQRAPQVAAGARDRCGRARPGPAQVPLPGPDGQRRAGERGLPGIRGVLRRGARTPPGRGRRDPVGGLG